MNCPIHPLQPSFGGPPNYSTVLYPNPPSHDFGIFCIISELMRRHHQSPDPLDIMLLTKGGKLGYIDFSHHSVNSGFAFECKVSADYSDIMIENVLKPAAEMIGARPLAALDLNDNPSPHFFLRRVEYDYHLSSLVDASRAGFEIPQWKVPDWAFKEIDDYLKGRKPVVITLRTTDAQPERNSRDPHWAGFCGELYDKKYDFLVIQDTKYAAYQYGGFETWQRPARNAYIRAALYQRALLNLMVGTGPMIWCVFSPAPYLIFKQLVPIVGWQQGWPEGWREQEHLEVGEQLPWATPFQKLTWKDDTFENLWEEFNLMMEKINHG